MKHNVEFKSFEPGNDYQREKQIRKVIEDEITRIEKRAKGFAPDTLFLRVLVEKNSAHKTYSVSITFEVPEKTLATKEEGRDVGTCIREAFAEIERQFDAYRATRRGQQDWRPARREEIRRKKVEVLPDQ